MNEETWTALKKLADAWSDRSVIYRNMGERSKADAYAKAAKELLQKIGSKPNQER